MSRFRKVHEIDAVCWNGATLGLTNKRVVLDPDKLHDPEVRLEMPDWLPACSQTLPTEAATVAATRTGEVRRFFDILYIGSRLDGTQAAMPGDWIVRGFVGDFYVCKGEVFSAAYEAVPDLPIDALAEAAAASPHFDTSQSGGVGARYGVTTDGIAETFAWFTDPEHALLYVDEDEKVFDLVTGELYAPAVQP